MHRLRLSLYGTRDATQNWAKTYGDVLESVGFEKGIASPCNVYHAQKEVYITCHGDDFIIIASVDNLKWSIEVMQSKFEIKSSILGPNDGQSKEIRILNRVIRWTPEGIEYDAYQRHADTIVEEWGLRNVGLCLHRAATIRR